jgi:hypothetical protein
MSWERWHEHHGGSENTPNEVAMARAHSSGGSMVRGGGRGAAAQRRSSAFVGSGERRGRLGLLQHRGRRATVRHGSI